MSGPLKRSLAGKSPLRTSVRDGLGALQRAHRAKIHDAVKEEISESLDLDAATRAAYPQANRWDYLLGHAPSGRIVGFEPHSASSKEVKVVIAKKSASQVHLRTELATKARVARWLWVASGTIEFVPFEKAVRQLEQNGITFVGKQLERKHLADL